MANQKKGKGVPGRKPNQTLPGAQCLGFFTQKRASTRSPSTASNVTDNASTDVNVNESNVDPIEPERVLEDQEQPDIDDTTNVGDMVRHIESPEPTQGRSTPDDVDRPVSVEEESSDQELELVPELDDSGVVAKYLREQRDDLVIKGSSKIYHNKEFWIHPKPAFYCLDGVALNPESLYHPRVFVWSPDRLIPDKFSCHKNSDYTKFDQCAGTLDGDGYGAKPVARRIVDIDSCFYLLSRQYRCNKCRTTVMAHDERIISRLPRHIQSIFPAYLTHRAGVSKQLFDLMHACFQNALGPERLHDLLYEQHTLHHSNLELTYLNTIAHRLKNPQIPDRISGTIKGNHIPFSKFDDPKGYAGYVPSATYLRLVYTALMDELRPLIDKEMMVIDGVILKGDHTFKIIKHMAKIGGEPTFYAVYTVCNEYEEIRLQLLVPTKKLSHLKPAFEEMLNSYRLYGHQQPEIFYTDNVTGDKAFLLENLPSLRRGIGASASESTMDLHPQGVHPDDPSYLSLPSHVTQRYISSAADANIYLDCLLRRTYPTADTPEGSTIVIGFDCEWNYGSTTGYTGPGKVATVQIAFEDTVTILPLHSYGSVPDKLAEVLQSNRVIKTGRNVGGDLKKIRRDYGVSFDEGSYVELGAFSCAQNFVSSGNASLSDICASVLHARLDKDDQIRMSDWEAPVLNPAQLYYAALDAWASLKVYHALIDHVNTQEDRDVCENTQEERAESVDVQVPRMTAYESSSDDDSDTSSEVESTLQERQELSTRHSNSNIPRSPVTRVLKDPFHLMAQIKVSRRHGLAKEFARRLRDTIFVPDEVDKARVVAYLQGQNLSWDHMLSTKPEWVLRRVKRRIPPPNVLASSVELLFSELGHLRCSRSHRPLFDDEAWRQAGSVLNSIRRGDVSDPPGISFYFETGRDGNQLPLYRCTRGTNSLEGGVHMNIVRKFASLGAGPHFTDCVLADYRLRHNIRVGAKNRYQKTHRGHYSPWLTESINTLRTDLGMDRLEPRMHDGYGTRRILAPSGNETFGIAAIPPQMATNLHMHPLLPQIRNYTMITKKTLLDTSTRLSIPNGTTSNPKSALYHFLSAKQAVVHPVVPMHTSAEYTLFAKMINNRVQGRPLDWEAFSREWNDHVNSITGTANIYYKSPEQLQTFYKSCWSTRRVAHDSIDSGRGVCEAMREHMQSPSRALPVEPAQIPMPLAITAPIPDDEQSMQSQINGIPTDPIPAMPRRVFALRPRPPAVSTPPMTPAQPIPYFCPSRPLATRPPTHTPPMAHVRPIPYFYPPRPLATNAPASTPFVSPARSISHLRSLRPAATTPPGFISLSATSNSNTNTPNLRRSSTFDLSDLPKKTYKETKNKYK